MEAKPKKPKVIVKIATPQDLKKIENDVNWGFLSNPKPANSKERVAIIALVQKKLVGSCVVDINLNRQDKARINSLYVDGNFGRKGIGHKLLGKAHAWLLKRGVKNTMVFSRMINRPFYKKAGYETKKHLSNGCMILYRPIWRAR